jgi:hypothetical protein
MILNYIEFDILIKKVKLNLSYQRKKIFVNKNQLTIEFKPEGLTEDFNYH